ncbi:MAG: hypothetical protein M3O02_08465 [Acidobacteriota bacterium]|nr:hypothetical protein [Acidobacteriota bacterium]
MNGSISIILEDGTTLTGTVRLNAESSATSPPAKSGAKSPIFHPSSDPSAELDFSLPVRPFINQYSDGLSGSKKFALLVAYFAKGELDVPVDRTEVVDTWNKMTGLLGGRFNGAHESRAKDAGWVYVPDTGKIALLKKWQQAVS